MLKELDNYDWAEAFRFVGGGGWGYDSPSFFVPGNVPHDPFDREDVVEIISMVDGSNDGPDWVGVFRLKDGRFASLSAGCDYTGWDCQAGGSSRVAATLDDLIRWGLTDGERERLNLLLPESTP